jgi:hypoxanthine phosphoribosyltransferase
MSMKKVSWEEIEDFVSAVVSIANEKTFCGVYGPARGGLPLAVMISHKANLPLLMSPADGCLIVDDIADTGQTLSKYAGKIFIATMFYHRQCSFIPDFWVHEKKKDWIVFPWEA